MASVERKALVQIRQRRRRFHARRSVTGGLDGKRRRQRIRTIQHNVTVRDKNVGWFGPRF